MKRIRVKPDGELANVLSEAAAAPVLLEVDGELYRVDRMDEDKDTIFVGYDPDKVVEAIDATAGSLSAEDAEALITTLYKAREEGSRPATRP